MSLRRLASGKIPGMAYPGHPHFVKRLLSRRGFLEKSGVTLGVLAASGLVPELTRAAVKTHGRNSTTSATPLPIPGGTQVFGPGSTVFHFFLPAPGAEPSAITNFNGFVGWAAVGGMGTHTVVGEAPEHVPFEADVRFMLGEFIGVDGRNHHGAFTFV